MAGLVTYLREVIQWMTTGLLPIRDTEYFFVRDAIPDCELGSVWHERYALRRDQAGKPYAPSCLFPMVDQAFATGKSKAFLGLLRPLSHDEDSLTAYNASSSFISCEALLRQMTDNPLQPFDHILEDSLHKWFAREQGGNKQRKGPLICGT